MQKFMNYNTQGKEYDLSQIKWIDQPVDKKFEDKIKWHEPDVQPKLKTTRYNVQEQNSSNPEFFYALIGSDHMSLIRQNNLIDCGPSAIYNLAQISNTANKLNLPANLTAYEVIGSLRQSQNHIDRNNQNNREYFSARDIRELLSRLFEIQNTLTSNEEFVVGGPMPIGRPEAINFQINQANQISNNPNNFRGIVINKNNHFVTLIPKNGQWYFIDSLAHRSNVENVVQLSNLQVEQRLIQADCYWAPKFNIKWL
jgi:Josephin